MTTAASTPAATHATKARIAAASMIRLAIGFPLPFTVDLLPKAVHELRELSCSEPGLSTQLHQFPGPFDDALIVAIDERRLALRPLDERAQAALETEQPRSEERR